MSGARLGRAATLAWLTATTAAVAEPSGADKAMAEVLFRDGRALLSADNVAEACPKLAESQRLDPRLGTLLNLAICHEKEGKTASAWAEYTDAASLATRQGQAEREKFAADKAAELERKLARVTLLVRDASPALEIRLDGKALGSGAWGTAIPLDPGDHRVEASAPGKLPFETRLSVQQGPSSAKLEIPPLAPRPTAAASAAPPPSASAPPSAPPPPPPTAQAPAEGSWRRPAGWISLGVGVVGLGLGTYFGIQTLSKHESSKAECDASGCTREGQALQRDAITASWVSTAGFAVGLAGAAAGAYLLVTSGRPPQAGATVTPLVAKGFTGASLQTSF